MTDADVFAVVKANHRALLDVLRVLDESPGTRPSADALRGAIWPVLQDYGLRDVQGSVWQPGSPLPSVALVPPCDCGDDGEGCGSSVLIGGSVTPTTEQVATHG